METTLESGEEIIMTVNKHWFVFVGSVISLLLFIILPLVIIAIFSATPQKETGGTGSSPILFFIGLWYLVVWIFFFIKWTDYYLDLFILTNRRVIYISQKGLFSRRISSSRLDRVQDVSAEVTGMMETFLDYGDVHVQTAGEEKEFVLRGLPNPSLIKDKILVQYGAAMNVPIKTAPEQARTEK